MQRLNARAPVHAAWTLRILAIAAATALLGLTSTACGNETEREPAIEAQEGNEFALGQIVYRVVLFRELNPEVTGDQALVEGVHRGADELLFAAFVRACNRGDDASTPTGAIELQKAFGTGYKPVEEGAEPAFAYKPRELGPGDCIPERGSVAERSFDGAALVFAVPSDITSNRPLILEVRETTGDKAARVELDL